MFDYYFDPITKTLTKQPWILLYVSFHLSISHREVNSGMMKRGMRDLSVIAILLIISQVFGGPELPQS
jgi:hypothetical protein